MENVSRSKYDKTIHFFGLIGYFLAFCINLYLVVTLQFTYLNICLAISCVGFLLMSIYHYRYLFVLKYLGPISKKVKQIYIEESVQSQYTLLHRFFAHIFLAIFFGLMIFQPISSKYLIDDAANYTMSCISHVYFIIKLVLGLEETPGAVGLFFAQMDKVFLLKYNSIFHYTSVISSFFIAMMYLMTILSEL